MEELDLRETILMHLNPLTCYRIQISHTVTRL